MLSFSGIFGLQVTGSITSSANHWISPSEYLTAAKITVLVREKCVKVCLMWGAGSEDCCLFGDFVVDEVKSALKDGQLS